MKIIINLIAKLKSKQKTKRIQEKIIMSKAKFHGLAGRQFKTFYGDGYYNFTVSNLKDKGWKVDSRNAI